MNEFTLAELRVGDRISRKVWKTFGVVESVERGVGTGPDGKPEPVTVKVNLRLNSADFVLDLEELSANDWIRVPDGHEKTSRWLTNEELTDWLRTGKEPDDWTPPIDKGLAEICADRIENASQAASRYYNVLLAEQAAISELGFDLMKIHDRAKEWMKRLEPDEHSS